MAEAALRETCPGQRPFSATEPRLFGLPGTGLVPCLHSFPLTGARPSVLRVVRAYLLERARNGSPSHTGSHQGRWPGCGGAGVAPGGGPRAARVREASCPAAVGTPLLQQACLPHAARLDVWCLSPY